MERLLAIDPGNIESAYCLINKETYVPIEIGKIDNFALLDKIHIWCANAQIDETVIEAVACYGMAVGKTVFDTAYWVGRFDQTLYEWENKTTLMYRTQIKKQINSKLPKGEKVTNDSSIISYLANRFAYNEPNRGKGKKDSPSYFYGFKADIWQAYAIGVAYLDKHKED